MSRSTESMSEGEEKLENSKNNLENEIPKVTPTTESKGARPKTSSTSIKPEKQTVEKKQLKVLTINAFGPNKGKGSTETRKHIIQIVIKRHEPDLVLFQELKWTKKVEKWPSDLLPIKYKFVGKSEETNIMYNINTLSVTDIQRDPHDSFDFNSRMCSSMFNINGVANTEFICISYHGRHNEKTDTDKLDEFENLKKFLTQLYEKHSLPILIGGDFNVNTELICKNVENPFKLYDYVPSARRKKNGVIDYFIASPNIDLFEIKKVDLKNYSKARIQENMKLILYVLIYLINFKKLHIPDMSQVDLTRDSKVCIQEYMKLIRYVLLILIHFKKLHLPDMTQVGLKRDSGARIQEYRKLIRYLLKYLIHFKKLHLSDMTPEEVLDHDPIKAMLKLTPPSDSSSPE